MSRHKKGVDKKTKFYLWTIVAKVVADITIIIGLGIILFVIVYTALK